MFGLRESVLSCRRLLEAWNELKSHENSMRLIHCPEENAQALKQLAELRDRLSVEEQLMEIMMEIESSIFRVPSTH